MAMVSSMKEWKTRGVASPPLARWAEISLDEGRTGALLVVLRERLVVSVPSQWGCPVGCRFCVSAASQFVRSLSAEEMSRCFEAALALAAPEEARRPVELSFTGEGEPLLNWRACAELVRALASAQRIQAVRFAFSGVGAEGLLTHCESAGLALRLQCSLHCALDAVRERLIPRSIPVARLEAALRRHAHRFDAVELNVVLQDGVNDSPEALAALLAFGEPHWPVLLNPLLTPTGSREALAADRFERALREAGRPVKRYGAVARDIGTQRIYPLMTGRASSPLAPVREG